MTTKPTRLGLATSNVLGNVLAAGLAAFLALACSSNDNQPAHKGDNAARPAPPSGKLLHIVLSASFVSEAGIPIFERITEYLSEKTSEQIALVTGLGYQTMNDMLIAGKVDIGFICGLPYVLLRDRDPPAVTLIAAPVMKNPRYHDKPQYFSDLIVRKDSEFRSIHDLKGRRLAYNEEMSNSGYNMPRHRLLELGYTNGFFSEVLRSGSHEESIRMVAEGRADASYVDSLVLDYVRTKGSGLADKVRVIDSVGPVGIPPVVVPSSLDPSVRDALARALLTMHEDPEGRAILDDALVERFVAVDDSNYQTIRDMNREASERGFTVIH